MDLRADALLRSESADSIVLLELLRTERVIVVEKIAENGREGRFCNSTNLSIIKLAFPLHAVSFCEWLAVEFKGWLRHLKSTNCYALCTKKLPDWTWGQRHICANLRTRFAVALVFLGFLDFLISSNQAWSMAGFTLFLMPGSLNSIDLSTPNRPPSSLAQGIRKFYRQIIRDTNLRLGCIWDHCK